ncbi:hypothetical protein JW926_07280 [Candidatus Sumerlaeota bacterium]|nr:hypothetical protein [Candidatus Sumerlaeota bacterium]
MKILSVFSWTLLISLLFFVALGQTSAAIPTQIPAPTQISCNVLILTPDVGSGGGNVSSLLAALAPYTDVNVTVWDTSAGNPSVSDLLNYCCVILGNDYLWNNMDKTTVGNNLADYIDQGGKVIEGLYIQSFDSWGFGGRYMTDGYSPFTPASTDVWGANTMNIIDSSHPVMVGVTSVSDDWGHQNPGLRSGAKLLATWNTSGHNYIAVNDNVVALNQLLHHASNWTGDVGIILHNAIIWLCAPCMPPSPPMNPNPPHKSRQAPWDVRLSWSKGLKGLYGIDSDLDHLYKINQNNGAAILIGSTGPEPSHPAGLAFDGIDMYVIDFNGGELFTLDITTGKTTYKGTTSISGWQALASDPTDNGQLYGITQSDVLYKVAGDGTPTLIASGVGDLITALEFDGNGVLWGVELSNGNIYTIGKESGALTIITTTIAGFQGIAFDEKGILWGHNTDTDSLYVINLSTGAATLIGANATQFVKGLDFNFAAGAPVLITSPGKPLLPSKSQSTAPASSFEKVIDLTTVVNTEINASLILKYDIQEEGCEDEIPEGYTIIDGVLVEGDIAPESCGINSNNKISFATEGETLIDFDDVSAPCTFSSTIHLTNEYETRGVIFEGPWGKNGGAILNECGGFGVSGHSSPNFLAFNSNSTLSDAGKPQDPETIHFLFPVLYVQILAGSNSGAGNDITMEAYNAQNELVDSDMIVLNPTLAPLSVSVYGITRVVISTSAAVFVLDDLIYTGFCPESYDVYIGTENPPTTLLCENITDTFCDAGDLLFNTTYFWQVIAKNETGEAPGHVWSFSIGNYFWLDAEPADMDTGIVTLEDLSTPAAGWYEENTTATLYAVPICGFKFDHWSVNLSGSENPAEVFMDGDKNILAHFSKCTINVPDDFATIQEAIDSAHPLDRCEIIVQPDIYFENINFGGKNIILRSTDPFDPAVVAATIIDGSSNGSVVTFGGSETECATLAGFTITNGKSSSGGGVNGNGALATIHHNIITTNTVTEVSYGGGLLSCQGDISHNIITFNTAYMGGGLSNCNGTISNCVIAFNSAFECGGLDFCNSNIWNNTIYGNSADIMGGGMGYCYGNILNCIIWGNTAPMNPQIGYSNDPNNSCVEEWAGGGVGNITENPEIVDLANLDFHLRDISPCIDAGTTIPLEFDFEMDPRMFRAIHWETRGDGSFVDMGADEYIGIIPFGDPPQLTILTPSGERDLTKNTYIIGWMDSDDDHDAMISLFYDTNNSGENGVEIVSGISEDSSVNEFGWDVSLTPEGIYWIYGKIDDGMNLPHLCYSPGSLMVSRVTLEEIRNHLLAIDSLSTDRLILADYNRDGGIDIADLIFLINWQ